MLDDTVPLYDEKGYQNVTSVPHESSFYAFFLLTGNCIGMSCYFLCYPDIHSETCEFKNLRINKNLNIYKILQLLLHYYTIISPGLVGNTFVIYASMRYDAFGMDYATVHLIQQLAAADLIFIIMYLVPMMVTHLAHGWILGETLCVVTGMFCSVPVLANINFILAVSIHRYARCKCPLDIVWLNKKRVRYLCLGLWIYSCLFIVYVYISKAKVSFQPKLGGCQFNFSTSVWNLLVILFTTVVPFLVILTLNVGLWVFVRNIVKKTRRRSGCVDCSDKRNKKNVKCRTSHQALVMTSCITAFFIVCWFPTLIRFVLSAIIGEENIPTFLERIRYVYFVGTYGNPILYTTVSKKFRNFLWQHLRRMFREKCSAETGTHSLASLQHHTLRSPLPGFMRRNGADTRSLKGTPPAHRKRDLLSPLPPRCNSR